MTEQSDPTQPGTASLAAQIHIWAAELGLQGIGIAGTELNTEEARLEKWLGQGRHGTMAWMARHGRKRSRPELLVENTRSVISVRMDYWPGSAAEPWSVLNDPGSAYLSRYALGRDYHKLLRARLKQLAARIEAVIGPFGHRIFVDSAPVLEKPLAARAGLGWIGKHTNLISREGGSWFFIGELYTELALPTGVPEPDHCGSCTACIDACPTRAITAPYQLDARLCISYLTIEHDGPIPEPLRPLLGNRIYGCDDCQLVCPWNRFATPTPEQDFLPRHGLDAPGLVDLFGWDEATFLSRTEGTPIRRIGHERWLRNIAVALGNGETTTATRAALAARTDDPSAVVREHVGWALARLGSRTG